MKRLYTIISLLLCFSLTAICAIYTTPAAQKISIKQQLAKSSGSRKVELLLKLSTLNHDSLKIANACAQEALRDALRLYDNYLIGRVYTTLATLKQIDGSPDDSVVIYLRKADKAFTESGHTWFHPEFYYTKAKFYFRNEDLNTAAAMCKLALESAQKQNNTVILADTYLLLARIHKQKANSSEFVACLMQSEKYYRQSNDKEAAGRALISVGLLYNDAGMTDVAQKVMARATHLCEQTSDSLFIAYLYCNISGVYKSGSNQDKAYLLLMKAVTIFINLHNDKGLGYAQNMLGLYSLELKKYDNAHAWFMKTIQSKSRCNDWQGACFAACNIADMQMKLKKYDPVVAALAEAKTYMKKSGDKLSEIVYFNTLGRFNQLDKNYPEASVNLTTSLILAKQTGDANFYLQNLKTLSDLHYAAGDESKALYFFRRYSEAGDSIRNATKPLQQEEIMNELNSDELIGKAVREMENQPKNTSWTPSDFLILAGIVLLFVLSAWFYKRKYRFLPLDDRGRIIINSASTSNERETKLILSEQIQHSIWARIELAMVEKKLYLHNDLTLHELASLLETNTLYISKVINMHTGQNFSSFVNHYRIDEACRLLVADKKQVMSIEGIALSSGFNSKSAFNSAFKKLKGFTPSEFIEKQKIAV